MSTTEGDEFLGREIKGKIGQFFVILGLDTGEHLTIILENESTFDVYKCRVESVDIGQQNYTSGVSWIDTPSELFQAIDSILSSNKQLSQIMEFDQADIIKFELELKLDFRTGSKKQKIVYRFRTQKMPLNEIEIMRSKFHTLVSEREADALKIRKLEEQVSKLALENEKLHQQMNKIKSKLSTQEQLKRQNPCFEYTSAKSIVFTNPQNTIAFQTRRAFDIVLVNKPINPFQWKFVIHTPMELVFGLCKKTAIKETDQYLKELLFRQYDVQEPIAVIDFNLVQANSIVTCNFDGIVFQFSVESLQSIKEEGDGEEEEQMSYSKITNEKIMKRLLKYDNIHAFVGLNHGRRVELLSYEVISEN